MKKVLSLVLALACVLSLSAVAFAADAVDPAKVYNGDGEEVSDISVAANVIKGDPVEPASTFYVPISPAMDTQIKDGDDVDFTVEDLVDTKNFKFDVDKDAGSKLISKISVVDDKKLGSMERTAYLKFELKDVTDTDEHKSTGTITFKAKNYKLAGCKPGSKTESSGANDAKWTDNYEVTFKYNLWISNEKKGNDDNPDVGDRVYMDPDKNDTNTLIWGDDRAALKFEADDDAKKFYARLSTSNMSDIYAEYGDPVDADLWFYDFVGHPTVPATSKATLTLGIPWDDDDDYTPDPENCFIYELDADGYLTDVTSKFTYSEDDEEIPGWSIRTRQLGTYIVSDTELDVTVDEPETSEPADVETPTNNGKDIPNTGSSDMVNVALVAAVVSLAAAGAVAFRKVK
ncbi:LPXTG cell wall anchor domain-containing protein [Anaerotruncus massiliensis (ex Togo et al. 2019)]|mgnify:FL=1|uniref:LPXTG cell wall anchor domain-containing protein n=2 Tax=Anaerotruncus TaxID=244127 RepID=UPI000C78C0F6|nr:LPXTG cell wall anchor domain-containing protein [Anaerotruncus massiliensis (ex Togo et al. 2019)]